MALWIFTRKILAGEPIQLFNQGRMRRDFTYVDDIVSGILACHDNAPPDDGQIKAGGSRGPHRIYNIGNDRAEELTRLVALIEAACGRKASLELLPMQPGDVAETLADISAIRRDMGFAPTTSIETGVPRFVAWYLDYRGRRAS
jgi:UDP-glucuronate 4-epimerase